MAHSALIFRNCREAIPWHRSEEALVYNTLQQCRQGSTCEGKQEGTSSGSNVTATGREQVDEEVDNKWVRMCG